MALGAIPAISPARGDVGATTQSQFVYQGQLKQGGWIVGRAPLGATRAFLGDTELQLDGQGRFFAAFDRDSSGEVTLRALMKNGAADLTTLNIAPRAWRIEHVNVARRKGGASEAWWARRKPELDAIGAARAQETGANGWQQSFVWPVKGRISGRFGAQRIYRGEPASYHSGMDIATGASGTPYVAPADGVVVLAVSNFSLEGNLLIIDHGQGLNSAFLHSSKLLVKQGDMVRQGQVIGHIGSTGRASGPHLHWSIKWHDARLDPLLFVES